MEQNPSEALPGTSKDPKRRQRSSKTVNLVRPSSEAGPSTLAGPSKSPVKEKRRHKKGKGQHDASDVKKRTHRRSTHRHETSQAERSNGWDAIPITERSVSKIPPVWSRDRRIFFTVSGTSIHIHSATPPSYKLLSTLSGFTKNGHRKDITSLVLHPTNPMQLITSADDGMIKIWDWVEGRLVRTIAFSKEGKVKQICLGQIGGKWQIFGTVETTKRDKVKEKALVHSWKILRSPLVLPPGTTTDSLSDVGKLSYRPAALIISPRHTYLVALSGNKAYTYRLPSELPNGHWVKPTCVKFVSDQDFTCGAFAPERIIGNGNEEEWFATGDVKGVIRLWHGLTTAFRQVDFQSGSANPQEPGRDADKRLPTTSLHWHAHAVGAIAFTPSGAQLLSVGEESVLVQWHLASGKREYLPRLGGRPIVSLAVNPGGRGVEEEWWIRNLDGGVLKVGAASGQIVNIGQGIRIDPLRSQDTKYYPLTLHPPTRSLVVPSSHPSTLQFIDPFSSTVLFDLEVAPSNRIARRDERELEPVSVEHVAFNEVTEGGNRWMATIEGRMGDELEGGGFVKTLKVWIWTGDRYIISTQYPRPHGTSDITTLTFVPSPSTVAGANTTDNAPYLLTTSIDGIAKIWNVRQSRKPEQGKSGKKPSNPVIELFWSMRSSFSYRSLPIYGAAFSPDSSILAFAQGSVITIWDVGGNTLLQVLDGGLSDYQRVGFVGREGRYLAAAGDSTGLAVWDLLSLEVTWANPAARCHRLLTSTADFFVVAHHTSLHAQTTEISVYSSGTPKPSRTVVAKTRTNDLRLLPTSSLLDPRALQFVSVSSGGEITRFGDDIARAVQTGANKVGDKGEKTTSIWQEMFGKDAFLEIEEQPQDIPTEVAKPRTGKPTEVFDGPSHTLPPVSLLFDAFLEEILVPRSALPRKEDVVVDEIVYDVPLDGPADQGIVSDIAGREVGDEEVRELELFFRDLLKAKPLSNGHGLANGKKVLSNGNPESDEEVEPAVTPSVTPNKKSTPKSKTSQDVGEEYEENVAVSGGKQRPRKRKAVKEHTS